MNTSTPQSKSLWSDQQILDMVNEETGRLNPAVYSDESLYELELERVFGRSWLLLGDHRSRTVVYFLWSADAFRLAKSRECAPSLP